MAHWLELIPDYRCNNRCLGCFAVQENGPSMDASELSDTLRWGRSQGCTKLWLGGGEPTLRKELPGIVKVARSLGYEQIKLQTNGMLLAYRAFTEQCANAGVTEVAFSLKGATQETHDRLARTPGSHALAIEGMQHARACGLTLEADLLLYRSNARELPAMVQTYRALGVERFRAWMLSPWENIDPEAKLEAPSIQELRPQLEEAIRLAPNTIDGFVSLHTPPCTLSPAYRAHAFFAPSLQLLVANPGKHRFKLESSPMEGGAFLPSCDRCSLRSQCNGPRRDYIQQHGSAEFQPVETHASAT